MKTYRLPPQLLPLTIEALHGETREVVWSRRIECAEGDLELLHIPPLARQFGHPVIIRIRYADGTVTEAAPPPRPN